MSKAVIVESLPDCDLCPAVGRPDTLALYDAKTTVGRGSWAYLCEDCFVEFGPGRLGTGYGQRLVLRSEVES